MQAPLDKKSSPKKAAKPAGHSPIAVAVISVITGITILSLATFNHTDISCIYDTTNPQGTANLLGFFGAYWASLFLYYFGISAWLIPITLLYCIRIMLFNLTWKRELDRLGALMLMLFISTAINHTYTFELYRGINPGGWWGSMVTILLASFFSERNVELFLFALSWGLGIIIARFSSISYLYPVGGLLSRLPVKNFMQRSMNGCRAAWATIASALPSSPKGDVLGVPDEFNEPIQPATASSIGLEPAWNSVSPQIHGRARSPPRPGPSTH